MKKLFTLFIFSVVILYADPLSQNSTNSLAITFETGKISMLLDEFDRIDVYAPDLETKQIDQLTLMIGGYEESVFDYRGDAANADSVTGPQEDDSTGLADYALTDTIDNSYSNNRPAFQVIYDVYGWNNAAYSIIKATIKNIDSLYSYDAKPGFDIMPQIEGEFGDEEYEYVSGRDYFRVFREDSASATNIGFKFLNSSITSLAAIPWYRAYNSTDSVLYKYLNYGSIESSYQSDSAGSIIFVSTESTVVDTGESFEVYFAVAVGDDASLLDSAIADAEEKYTSLITSTVTDDIVKPVNFSLSQNYPNPFNPSTFIEFEIPSANIVELKVYDILGREIRTLIDEYRNAGVYKVKFDASALASGVYFYQLKSGDFIQTKKMLLMK